MARRCWRRRAGGADRPTQAGDGNGKRQQQPRRKARQQGQKGQKPGSDVERALVAGELRRRVAPEWLPRGGARDDDAGGGGNEQRGELGDQSIADSQRHVLLGGGYQVFTMYADPDDEAAGEIHHVMNSATRTLPATNFEAPSMAP